MPDAPSQNPSAKSSDSTTPSGRRSWWFPFLFLIGVVGLASWFLPEIVARTALRQQVPKVLFPFFKGNVELGETTLGWNSPVVVKSVKIADAAGEPLLSIGELRSSATLWELATGGNSLGRFDLQDLAARVVSQPTGTNFDQTIRDFLAAPASGAPRPFELVCVGAQILLANAQNDAASELPPIDVRLRVGMEQPRGITLDLASHQQVGEGPAGAASRLTLEVLDENASSDALIYQMQAEHWQLAQFAPLIRVWRPEGDVWGELNGSAKLRAIDEPTTRYELETNLNLVDLNLLNWPEFQGDELRVKRAQLQGKATYQADVVSCERVSLQSELAEVQVQGQFVWPGARATPASSSSTELLDWIDQNFQLTGWIDAAAIAQQLPQTLQLKSGTRLTAGRVNLTVNGDQNADIARNDRAAIDLAENQGEGLKSGSPRTWQGKLQFDRLAAVVDGQQWVWDEPLSADWRVADTADGWVCEQLTVHSDFLEADGRGSLQGGQLSISANLDRLTERLAALRDEAGLRARGQLMLKADVTAGEAGRLDLTSQAEVRDFAWGPAAAPTWTEPALTAELRVAGTRGTQSAIQEIQSGELVMSAGTDRLNLKLLKAIVWTDKTAVIPLEGTVEGDLSRWALRLQPVVTTPLSNLEGQGVASAKVYVSSDEIVVERATVSGKGVQFQLPDWHVRTEQLAVTTQGRWNIAAEEWTSPETTVEGSFGRVVWKNGRFVGTSPAVLPLAGDIDFQLDVGQVSQWRTGEVTTHLLGTARGVLRTQPAGPVSTFAVDAELERVVLAVLEPIGTPEYAGGPTPAKWVAKWREPRVQVRSQARFTPESSQWELRNLSVTADGLTVSGELQTQTAGRGWTLETQGQLAYDWARLSGRMDPELAKKLQIQGQGTRSFQLRGQGSTAAPGQVAATATSLSGQFGVGWSSARVWGVPVSAADLQATFTGDSGRITPLDLTVAEGRVRLAPQVQFGPQGTILQLPAGRLADRIRLSPELCQETLKLAMPILADATQIDGRFSVDLSQASWPLSDPSRGQAAGRIEIEGAQVIPGGMANQLLGVIEQVRNLVRGRVGSTPLAQRVQIELPAQVVQFQQSQGRVSHDRLQFRTPDVAIETRGSVGFDETLDLVASVPIADSWISDDRLRKAFGGQTVQIPIRGSLRQPQIDPSIVNQLAQRAIGNQVGNQIEKVLEGRLQDQLNKFLPR